MRRLLGDAVWVLLGMGIACVIALAAIWALLSRLEDPVGDPTWDGEVAFVATCSTGSPCQITSVPDETPGLAVKRKPGGTIFSPLPSEMAGLRTGDRLVCTVHIEVVPGPPVNDSDTNTTVKSCRRQ